MLLKIGGTSVLQKKLNVHIYWKDLEGTYQWSNDTQAIALGLISGKDIIGKSDFDLPWKNQAMQLRKNNQKIISTGKETSLEEQVEISPGNFRFFLSEKFPIMDENKKTIGILGISTDITDKKGSSP